METTTTPLSDREMYFQARIEVLEKQLTEAKELLQQAVKAMEVNNFERL